MSSPSISPNFKRVRVLSPVKLQPIPLNHLELDDLPLLVGGNFNDEELDFEDLQLFLGDFLGTPPDKTNDDEVELTKRQIELTDQLIQVTEENNKLRRELEFFKEEVNERFAKLEENSQRQINEVSDIADNPEESDDIATGREPGNTVSEGDNNDGSGPDTEVGEPDDTATGLPVLGSLDETHDENVAREVPETVIGQIADTNTNNTANTTTNTTTETAVTCYACKDPVTHNTRRRIINNERRDMCAHCAAHIYRVLFPSVYTHTYWGEKPPPQPYINVPPGIDLEATMKAARGAGWQRKSPGAAKIKTVVGYNLTEPFLEIIMDTYKDFCGKYPMQPGRRWGYWKKIGFTALKKFDEHFEPSKKHTSLGSVIHDIIDAKLGE